MIIPLANANYGPAKEFIRLTTASPDAASAKLVYSVYDNDPNRQMLLIREALKSASVVYVYILTEGTEVQAEIPMSVQTDEGESVNKLTAFAKYGGTRGNAFVVTIDANPLGGYDVLINLDGVKVAEYEGLETVEELIDWITCILLLRALAVWEKPQALRLQEARTAKPLTRI